MYKPDINSDSNEKRLFKLNQKWLIESELWLCFLIVIELATVYRLAIINDKRMKIGQELGIAEEELKKLDY